MYAYVSVCVCALSQDVLYVIGVQNVLVVRCMDTSNQGEIAACCLSS